MCHRNSDYKNGFEISTRDKVLKAWDKSAELVRDFETYSNEIKDDKEIAHLFGEYAKDEGFHAARLLELLQGYDEK